MPEIHSWWDWLWSGLPGDARSAVVGSIVGSIISLGWAALSDPGPPREVQIHVNDAGFAKPLPALIAELSKDPNPIEVSFNPPELRGVWVCEYSHLTGYSGQEMLFAYLNKYSMCLSVKQKSDQQFVILPNRKSADDLSFESGEWYCKCN